MDESLYWLGFSIFPGIGPATLQKLLTTFNSAQNAWEGSETGLAEVLNKKQLAEFLLFRKSFDLQNYVAKLAEKHVIFVTAKDENYPPLLKKITKPPLVLYIKGNASLLFSSKTIAVVGTRKITTYGREITEMLTRELVYNGFTIVSGLALGVDAVAHQATLDAGGKTIAVLGCGVDCCYPTTNQKLYEDILAAGGAVVSEFPLSQSPLPGAFPSRNRIIAGLSQAVLVTEGAADSGSFITAELALKENRKVFAVPGPITSSLSVGPYKLLKQGATLVSSVAEITQELGLKQTLDSKLNVQKKGDTKEEQAILDLLANEPLQFDEVVRRLNSSSATVGTLISLMEIKGIVKNSDGYISLSNSS